MLEDILALVFIFGGGTVIALAFSPVGRALADRIRHRNIGSQPDPDLQEELAHLRDGLNELQERMDFTERVLTQRSEPQPIPLSERGAVER